MNRWKRRKAKAPSAEWGRHTVARDDARCGFEIAFVHFNVANKLTGNSLGAEKRRFDVVRRQENAGRRTRQTPIRASYRIFRQFQEIFLN
jgi:hypothetical protein